MESSVNRTDMRGREVGREVSGVKEQKLLAPLCNFPAHEYRESPLQDVSRGGTGGNYVLTELPDPCVWRDRGPGRSISQLGADCAD